MSNEWDFYFCRIDDRPASIMLDLGLAAAVPDPERPWLLSLRLPLQRPRPEDGLSSSEEAPALAAVEDLLDAELAAACGALRAGRLTWNGLRELFYYARAEGQARAEDCLDRALAAVARAHPDREVLSRTDHDPEWTHYREFLYPSPGQLQWIRDRRVVDQLRAHGDHLEIPRPVDHYLHFPDAPSRDAFLQSATAAGFRSEPTPDESTSTLPYGAHLVRTDPVDLPHIHDVVLDLIALAEPHAGDYDGWGAPIQRG